MSATACIPAGKPVSNGKGGKINWDDVLTSILHQLDYKELTPAGTGAIVLCEREIQLPGSCWTVPDIEHQLCMYVRPVRFVYFAWKGFFFFFLNLFYCCFLQSSLGSSHSSLPQNPGNPWMNRKSIFTFQFWKRRNMIMVKNVFLAWDKMLLSTLSLAKPTFLLSCISRGTFPHYLYYAN